jgi:hypothetical protein
MKVHRLVPLAAAVLLASPFDGRADLIHLNISYNVAAGAGPEPTTSDARTDSIDGFNESPITAFGHAGAVSDGTPVYPHHDQVDVFYVLDAGLGALHMTMGGTADSETMPGLLNQSRADAGGSISAYWTDTTTFVDEPANGHPVKVFATLKLEGSERGSSDGLSPTGHGHNGSWSTSVVLEGLGLLSQGSGGQGATLAHYYVGGLGVPTVDLDATENIPISYLATLGDPAVFGEQMTINGAASASTLFNAPGEVDSLFTSNYSHTLRWGGISSVVDLTTGQELEGWSVSSASGFDYSQPAPIPEPAGVAIAGLVLGGVGLRGRRGRRQL